MPASTENWFTALDNEFVVAQNAGHVDHLVKEQTLPKALEYIWHDYPIQAAKN